MTADLVTILVCDRDLQEVPRNPLMPEDRSGVFDRGADVKVAAVRVVRGNEVKPPVVAVVEPRRIHESPGTRRLERLGQLADEERADVAGNRDQVLVAQKLHHLIETALVRGEERGLIGGNR